MKRLAILGSTGSIGRSTLAVLRFHQERFRVVALAAAWLGPRAQAAPIVRVLLEDGLDAPVAAGAERGEGGGGGHGLSGGDVGHGLGRPGGVRSAGGGQQQQGRQTELKPGGRIR